MYRILFQKYQNGLSHFLGIRFQPHSMQNYLSPAVFFLNEKSCFYLVVDFFDKPLCRLVSRVEYEAVVAGRKTICKSR